MALYLQSRLLVFPSDDAALVRAYGNADFQCLFRKNALDILRPFDEAQAAAVNVVVEAYVESLFRAGDSVEVEVEYRISVRSLVFESLMIYLPPSYFVIDVISYIVFP